MLSSVAVGEAPDRITVFAASGTIKAMESVGRAYKEHTGREVLLNFDSSSRLARQIRAGARADVFISANRRWIDYLIEKTVVDPADCADILSTELVLIVPADSPAAEIQLPDCFNDMDSDSIAIADYTHVPAGIYARQALLSMDIWDAVEDNVVTASNVADVVRFVETKQCDMGIVYKSSALSSDRVRVLASFGKESHDVVTFKTAICSDSKANALRFVEFMRSSQAESIFSSNGFSLCDESSAVRMSNAAGPVIEIWPILKLSVKVAVVCVVIVSVPGILLGWLFARKDFFGKTLLEAFVHLPLVMPPVVTGYLALLVLGKNGILGSLLDDCLDISIAFTWYAAVIASALMGMPLLIRSVKLAIQMIDTRLEHAAASLGVRPVRVFLSVTFPLALPGIIGGMILAFARSLGEFGATATFAGNIPGQTRTLSLAIHSISQVPGAESSAIKLVCISIVVSIAAMTISEIINKKIISSAGGIANA